MYFLNANVTFTKIDHILSHKTSLSKFQKIQIIQSIFSHHSKSKLEIHNTKKIKIWFGGCGTHRSQSDFSHLWMVNMSTPGGV